VYWPARAQLCLGMGLMLVLFSVVVGLLAQAEPPTCTYRPDETHCTTTGSPPPR
jgi:hypothetical protein